MRLSNIFGKKTKTITVTEPAVQEDTRDARIESIMEKTGWTKNQTEEEIAKAKQEYGFSLKQYIRYEVYRLSDEEKEEKMTEITERKEKLDRQKAHAARKVSEATGWTEEESAEKISIAKKTIGVGFKDYVRYEFYNLSENEQKEAFEKLSERRKAEKEKNISDGPERPFSSKISAITEKGIQFYWKKVEIATGYEIFRSYKALGPYEKIADIDKRNKGTYIDSDFDHSKKKIYYSVRSYIDNEDGTRTVSARLEPVAAEYNKKIEINREVTYMFDGTSRRLRAIYGWGEPEGAVWESDNEDVAVVNERGIVTGIGTGECTITCSLPAEKTSAKTRIVVNREEPPMKEYPSRFTYDESCGWWRNTDAEHGEEAVIVMVGDLMCGTSQITTQTKAGGWDFTDSFEFVKEVTADSDLAVCNLETLLASGWPYMADEVYINNTNNCNAPASYADAVKYGGFDAVMMANNHNCDGGVRALRQTVEAVEKRKMIRTGLFTDPLEDRFAIADVNGIKVGFVAYNTKTTGFNGKEKKWSIEDREGLLNIFDPDKAKEHIKACRERGAEYVIAYMHWGQKNFRNLTENQRIEAQQIADAGADYIVGANPHVLQIYDEIESSDGRKVPCFYSIGNFQAVMDQVEGNRDSVMVRIKIGRGEDGSPVLRENGYIPFHCFTRARGSRWAPVAQTDSYNIKGKKDRKAMARIEQAIGGRIEKI